MKTKRKQVVEIPLAWGMKRITYEIMTDSKGVKWAVPTLIDGNPVKYLRRYDPSEYAGTFERITLKC